MDHFRSSVDLAPADLPTDAMMDRLVQECARLARLGVQYFSVEDAASEDLDAAEAAFRRCLFLLPDDVQYRCQLGQVLTQRGRAGLEEAERLFSGAVADQRRDALDPSMPLLFQIEALKLLGKRAVAEQLGRDFLENPGDADAGRVEQIRMSIAR